MRNTILTVAVLGLGLAGASAASAAPTTYSEGQTARVELRRDAGEPAYRLSGEQQRNVERRTEFRDVPRGRGETHSLPFRVTVPRE